MKKTLKKLFASVLALAMMLTTFTLSGVTASADEEGYLFFLGMGGHNDWSLCYHGPDATDDNDAIVATTAMVKEGDTVTIGLELPSVSDYTWWLAPTLVAEGVTELDYTINSILVDGVDVLANVDLAAGDAWWYEGTGPYTKDQAIRLAGGYNEWGTKYMAAGPANFQKIEYNVTFNKISTGSAAGESAVAGPEDEFPMFLGMGAHNDWSLCYHGPEATDDNDAIVATTATAHVGDTVTIGLELPSVADCTWWLAPVMLAENVANVDYTINSILVDGVDVLANVDLAAGDAWWYEGTGPYTKDQAIRLAGGYNEWGTKYMAAGPANFQKIEYSITLNSVEYVSAAGTLSTEEYPAFIAFGGHNDWSMQYYGENNSGNSGDITATNGVLKNGETTVLALEFGAQPDYTWFIAPCMVVENVAAIADSTTFDVKVFVDGVEVASDISAGKMFWAEGTGDYTETQCIRIGGGYNEWGDQYMASPANFSKIEFHITPTIYVQEVVEEEAVQYDFDPNGTYHAYLGVQTPTWIFRNSWDDASYGAATEFFGELGFVEGTEWLPQGGTFTDVEITGNGTYTVKLEGYDFSGTFNDTPILEADGLFNLLFLSTDLPMNDAVVLSNLTLKMDGKEITTMAEPFLDPDKEAVQSALFANIWNNELPELPYYAAPTNSIEITFTVSGFANDAVVETPAEPEAPAETPSTEAPAETPATAEPAEGGVNPIVIVVVVVAVVAVAAVAGVMVAKKKKAN